MEVKAIVNQEALEENQNNFFEDLFSANGWVVFLFITMITVILQFFSRQFIVTDEFMYNSLSEQLTYERIEDMLEMQKGKVWIQYVAIPVILFLQTCLIAVCLNTGTFLLNVKVKFKNLFRVVLIASLVFLLSKIIFTGILMFSDVQTFDDFAKADIFSLLALVGQANLPTWSHMALGMINKFQILFILFLALGLRFSFRNEIKKPLSFVLKSYGAGILLWVVFLTFLIMNITP